MKDESISKSGSNPPLRTAFVIAVGMQKGGVAKTTNALHIAAALAQMGNHVLLWDVDENSGATKVLVPDQKRRSTTFDVIEGICSVEDAIVVGADLEVPENLDFIPSSRSLQSLDLPRPQAEACLCKPLQALRALGRYDYIILDTGPQASATTRSAYLTSDYFVLSLIPEAQAIRSLPDALLDIKNARRADRNPELRLLGLVLSNVDRRKAEHKYYETALSAERMVDRHGRPIMFKTTIGTGEAINRAYKRNRSLLTDAPSHRVAKQYRALAHEMVQRIAEQRPGPSKKEEEPAPPLAARTEKEVAYG